MEFNPSYPSTADYFNAKANSEKDSINADRLLSRAQRYASGNLAAEIQQSIKRFENSLDQKVLTAQERDNQSKAKLEKSLR